MGPKSTPIAVRFWKKVNKDGPVPECRPDLGPCWVWVGNTGGSPRGIYGIIYRGQNESGKNPNGNECAHRVSYEIHSGPIPYAKEIDHLCKNTLCVNPQHLEAVTRLENVIRSNTPSMIARRRDLCKRGHILSKNRVGRTRNCALCAKIREASYR